MINEINENLGSSQLLPTTTYSREHFKPKDDKMAVISARRSHVRNEVQMNSQKQHEIQTNRSINKNENNVIFKSISKSVKTSVFEQEDIYLTSASSNMSIKNGINLSLQTSSLTAQRYTTSSQRCASYKYDTK